MLINADTGNQGTLIPSLTAKQEVLVEICPCVLIYHVSRAYGLTGQRPIGFQLTFYSDCPGLTGGETDLGSDSPPPGGSESLERDLGGDSWDQGSGSEGERWRMACSRLRRRAPYLQQNPLL